MTPYETNQTFQRGQSVLFVNMNEAQWGDRPVQIYQTLNQYV